MRTAIAALTLCLLSATASAQQVPGMATMDRFDQQSKFATSLSYPSFDADDVTGFRLDLFGQFLARSNIGGYAMVPFSYISSNDDSESALGNIELGGLYIVPGNVPVVLRGGIALATADENDFGANLTGIFARFNDGVQHQPDVTWLRLSAHPLVRQGNGFFKADIGLDLPLAENDGADGDTLVRINVGGGIQTGDIALIGELVNLATTEDNVDNRWINALAFTGRFMSPGGVQPSVSLQVPLDDFYEDIVDFVVIVGLEYIMPQR